MKYSPELATNYSEKREQFNETDELLFNTLESVGIKNKEVLDIGCGDGRHALFVKEMGAAHVMGVDISEKMVELAKEKAGANSDVMFLVADGNNLPVKNESMDIVFSNFVIHYFSDTKKFFNEISRVMKDKGYFVGTFNIVDAEKGFEHLYNQHIPIKLGKGEESIVVQNLIKSREEIREAISNSGLVIKEEQELDHPNAIIDDSFQDKARINKQAVLVILQKPSNK